VQQLLKSGASLDANGPDGRSALFYVHNATMAQALISV